MAISAGDRFFPNVVVMTKSYAYDRAWAAESVGRAMNALGRNQIDVMMLHEQESVHTLRGHREALDYYLALKEKGVIKAVGVSTHFVGCAAAVAKMPQVDVLSVPLNWKGYGIMDGSLLDMLSVTAGEAGGKGITAYEASGVGTSRAVPEKRLTMWRDWRMWIASLLECRMLWRWMVPDSF